MMSVFWGLSVQHHLLTEWQTLPSHSPQVSDNRIAQVLVSGSAHSNNQQISMFQCVLLPFWQRCAAASAFRVCHNSAMMPLSDGSGVGRVADTGAAWMMCSPVRCPWDTHCRTETEHQEGAASDQGKASSSKGEMGTGWGRGWTKAIVLETGRNSCRCSWTASLSANPNAVPTCNRNTLLPLQPHDMDRDQQQHHQELPRSSLTRRSLRRDCK